MDAAGPSADARVSGDASAARGTIERIVAKKERAFTYVWSLVTAALIAIFNFISNYITYSNTIATVHLHQQTTIKITIAAIKYSYKWQRQQN